MTAEQPAPRTHRNAVGVEFVTVSCDRCGFEHAHRVEQEAARPLPEPRHIEGPGEICDPSCPHWAWADQRGALPDRPEPSLNVERLTEAAHHAMCEVSHHGIGTICKNRRRYELVAESMWRRLSQPPDPATAHERESL